jgi:hypothetical protein
MGPSSLLFTAVYLLGSADAGWSNEGEAISSQGMPNEVIRSKFSGQMKSLREVSMSKVGSPADVSSPQLMVTQSVEMQLQVHASCMRIPFSSSHS